MNNFNLNLLKYFYYVAYYNGFTNASKSLNIAQSALSYNIKQLESQINKTLIIRDNKNFQLSEEGHSLFEVLKPIFSSLDKKLEQYNNEFIDEITIGVRHYLADFIFKDTINEFIIQYPNIHLNIKLYSKLDVNKFNDEYDILIDYDDYTNLVTSNEKITICSLKNILVAGKELFKKYENIDSLEQLSNVSLISMNPNRKNGKFQKLCFDSSMLFNSKISIDDSKLCKDLIKNNIGLCLVNEANVTKELANGELKRIPIKEEIFEDKVVLIYNKKSKLNNVMKFIELLENEYKECNNG